jgi:hypothetical protein
VAALRAGVLVQNRLLLQGADYVRAWGQESTDAAPRIGVMRQLGIPVGGGSDATRANRYSPWASIGWLVTGRSIDGATRRHERDRLSRHDAIASYTRDAAWFTGEDGWRGRLSPGYEADLCVPTADPFECAEDDLCDLRSDLTVVGGRVTHASGDLEGLRSSLGADIGYHALASGYPEGQEAGPACPSWCPVLQAIWSRAPLATAVARARVVTPRGQATPVLPRYWPPAEIGLWQARRRSRFRFSGSAGCSWITRCGPCRSVRPRPARW